MAVKKQKPENYMVEYIGRTTKTDYFSDYDTAERKYMEYIDSGKHKTGELTLYRRKGNKWVWLLQAVGGKGA